MVFSEHIWTVAKRDGTGPSADDYEKEVATLTIEKVREMQDRASET